MPSQTFTDAAGHRARIWFACCMFLATGCTSSPGRFSESNAEAHVDMLAGTIGSRPLGTEPNARARAYLVEQLDGYGFDVRIQEADAQRPALGLTARVFNIIAAKEGTRRDAVALVAHYDSVAETPGAADDAFGVAVVVEAARALAARARANYSLMVLLTDGEESGLMGAAALVEDRSITDRLRAYVNVEAIGAAGPAFLFETGPGNAWLLTPWARQAPHPRGASFALEIYKRLPNDTDFSIFKQAELPGLNFALIGDSYAYHTARDTPDRLATSAMRSAGENVVAIVEALDAAELSQRSVDEPIYFDIAGMSGLAYGRQVASAMAILAVLLGFVAWVRAIWVVYKMSGPVRILVAAAWTLVGLALIVAVTIGAVWALRAVRDVYHPWYAHPIRLLLLLATAGAATGYLVLRLATCLPGRPHAHPTLVWCLALPVWIALAIATEWLAPSASFLWTAPLLAAGVALAPTPLHRAHVVRLVSLGVLVVVGTLWMRDTLELYQFLVAVLGREPMITPVWIYPLFLLASGLMIIPPLIAVVVGHGRRLLEPSVAMTVSLLAVTIAAGLAYAAPAYTEERPLRRYIRYLQDEATGLAFWQIGANEPTLDLTAGAPRFNWQPVDSSPALSTPVGRFGHPFVFLAAAPAEADVPASIAARIEPREEEIDLEISVRPEENGIDVSFVMPPAMVPSAANLPGTVRASGRWTARYVAVPPEGIAFTATFAAADAAALPAAAVVITRARLPGGVGWQRLPSWLPQGRAVWSASSHLIVPIPLGAGNN